MDASNADPLVILDKMENIFRLRWNSMIEKCRSLEASIKEVNIEKEHLKIKLALSRERVVKIENERDTLAHIVKEFHQDLLGSPLYKIIGKLDQEVKSNMNDNSSMSDFDKKIKEKNENLCSGTISTVEYTDEQSCSPLINSAYVSCMGSVVQNRLLDSSESPNSVSNALSEKYLNEVTSLSDGNSDITQEKISSDIELFLSDDDDYVPPVTIKKELVISLPKTILKNVSIKDVMISTDSSDSDASTESPQNCIVCDEIFTAEEDLNRHMKEIHPNQFHEIRKLVVDFREKPKILPRLRSLDKQSQIPTDSSLHIKMEKEGEKRENLNDDIETNNFKKFKQLSPFVTSIE